MNGRDAIRILEADRTQSGLKLRTIIEAMWEAPRQTDLTAWCLSASAEYQPAWNRAVAILRLPESVRHVARWN